MVVGAAPPSARLGWVGIYVVGGATQEPGNTEWVFLGHESLTVVYISAVSGEIGYLGSGSPSGDVVKRMDAAAGEIEHGTANSGTVAAHDIDDVGMGHVSINGGEVRQWQQ
jgi:hypothetical protein